MGKNADRRREERRLRRNDRQDARTARALGRQATKQTAYEQGMDPNATLSNFINTAGGIVSGVVAGKNPATSRALAGGTKVSNAEPSDLKEWFEENKSLVLGGVGLLIGTKLFKLW